MNSFEMERPAPYHMQFYEQLKQMIFDGQFQPGERINETQLAKQFGVSRSPVREAMRLLEKDELLIADHRSGYSVYTLTERDVEELYQVRMALETLAVKLACKEATDREIDDIEINGVGLILTSTCSIRDTLKIRFPFLEIFTIKCICLHK